MGFLSAMPLAAADEGPVQALRSGTPHEVLFDIHATEQRIVAVGAGGAITTSSNGGQEWQSVEHDFTSLALLAVDQQRGLTVAVGQLGLVLIEKEGEGWKQVDSGTNQRLFSVSTNAHGAIVVGGEFGTLLLSENEGQTWRSIAPDDWEGYVRDAWGPAEPHIYGIHINDAGTITLAGEFGMILRTEDGGETWDEAVPGERTEPTLFGLMISERMDVPSFAVGQDGKILRSGDGGVSWQRIDVASEVEREGTTANLHKVTASPDGKVVVTGMRTMLLSRDHGEFWETVEQEDIIRNWYQGTTYVAGSSRFMAVGHSGRIVEVRFQ